MYPISGYYETSLTLLYMYNVNLADSKILEATYLRIFQYPSDVNSISISLDLTDKTMDCKTTLEHVKYASMTCKRKSIFDHKSRSHECAQIGSASTD